ncbi:RHS repeat domain-containing protein [Streptomyces mangrovi]|uniref:RHS repeat domain-containing protein n=1 Tax=Streptomyces mangrovi TaxID=1206892 RepID=UPI00399CCCC8
MAGLLLSSLLGGPVAAAAKLELRKAKDQAPVPTERVTAGKRNLPDETAGRGWKPTGTAWPKPGTGQARIPTGKAKPVGVTAGSLPVKLSRGQSKGAERAQVQVLGRSAAETVGVDGVLLAVRGYGQENAKGRVAVELDYSGFRDVYGGNWASRLTLREIPHCALTTPGKKGCTPGKVLKTRNDTRAGTLTAQIVLEAADAEQATGGKPVESSPAMRSSATRMAASQDTVLLAATAAPAGSAGSFTATSLSPSGKWTAGGSAGGFSWSYDLQTLSVPGGLTPEVSLAYSSQSVDGRTAATNNQANWAGDGWSLSPGFIERRYVSCEDDKKDGNNTVRVGDQCWKKHNATLSLNGSSSELIRVGTTDEWRKEDDDGTRVTLLTSSNRGNGDDNGEYWRVTTPNGTRYYFGYNRLPGWAEGKPETNSTWTVPVYGNHTGEPCHASAFKDSWCQQAWRWNLDYVVDTHSNAMAYYWNKETNHYGRNTDPATGKGTPTAYTRGGNLDRVEYGLRSNRMFADKAAAKVDFTVSERCLPTDTFDCAADKFTETNAAKWPDVPFDQYCKSGDTCESNASPSYWTRKRLTGITTSALVDGAYQKVDSWKLEHSFPSTGDGNDPPLWLKSITRTGHTGGTPITLPPVSFRGVQMPNRVSGAVDAIPAYNRYRVYAIDTESGGTVGVTYSATDCTAGALPQPETNTKRCYPVIWSPPEAPAPDYEPYQDWFHSYVVTQVLEIDHTGGAPAKQTAYKYLGGLAWAKNEDEFTKAEHRAYGDRRGYGRVQAIVGTTDDQQTLTESRYFRGIDGAQVADSEGAEVTDHKALAGMTRETATYDGVGGDLVTATSYTPWRSAPTATRTRSGLTDLEARYTGIKEEETRTAVSGDKLSRTGIARTFDSHGMVSTTSETGDKAKAGDERCTTTTYARNTTANILTPVAETRTVAVSCSSTPDLPEDLVSAERHYYDGSTDLGTAPTKGDITRTDENDAAGTGHITVNTATYDQYGRQLTATDATGETTSTAYTPATGQAPHTTTATNALGHTETTHTDPRRAVTTAVVDANGKRTDLAYDALGRLTKAWEPGWSKADHETKPAVEFAYRVSKTDPTVVTTKTLRNDGSYATAHTFYDGLLRERETQSPAAGVTNGKVVTEKLYDTLGRVWKNYSPYYASGAPSTTLVTGDDTKVPAATETRFDGAGRPVAAIYLKFGDETKRTTTTYTGDRTTVVPPAGGTAQTTVTDALGRVIERLSYTNADRTTYVKATYAYDQRGELNKMTDAAGNTWTWNFDARGRQTKAEDPDKGTTTTVYDDLDRPVKTTDARGVALATSYDALGRKTELKQGDELLARWTYDTLAKGQPVTDTRYEDGHAYTTEIGGYNDRYQPTSSTITLPDSAGALAGSYRWSYGYNQYTGTQEWISQPAMGGLPSERVTTIHNTDNLPTRTVAGRQALVNAVTYDQLSRPIRTEYGILGRKVYETRDWDEHTGELTRHTLDGDVALRIEDTRYTHDDAGNITRISSTSGQDDGAVTDNQCFATDALRRMTQAWTTKTATDDCATGPSSATVGGPDAYWHTYSYDVTGNRTKEIRHATLSGDEDITRTYAYGQPGQDAPHALRSVTTTGGTADGQQETFAYDAAGNTITRAGGTRGQELTWDAEGHLATVTEDGKTTAYLYDASGNRLIARNADGSTTAYLPGGNELKTTGSTVTGTRYYSHGDQNVAVRTSDGAVTFLFPDHHGTALVAVGWGVGQAVTRRKQLPFGGPRSSSGSWPGNRGFLSGTTDPTGTTHLGAREYDPQLGRFLSVDPLLIPEDQRQHNPYQYGNNNPATFSDPTGMVLYDDITGLGYGNTTALKNNYKKQGYIDSKGNTTQKYHDKLSNMQKSFQEYWNTCGMDPECNGTAAAERRAAEIRAERKAAEAQRKKNDADEGFFKGILRNVGDNLSNRWERVKSNVTSLDWWKHKGVDMMVTTAAVAGTAACIASVACGAGLFAVGAAALFTAGLAGHMAMATEEERKKGAGQFMLRTAKAEIKGIAAGTLFGRGITGAAFTGGSTKYTRWAIKGGHARINSIVSGPRQGGMPILWRFRGGKGIL